MLAKGNRIKKKKDFETIFKKGLGYKSNLLILKIIKSSFNTNRFGFVVSQKVSKKSVLRNKVRRRLAEVVRLESDHIKPGIDVVLIALPGIEKKNFSEIKISLMGLFKKAEII